MLILLLIKLARFLWGGSCKVNSAALKDLCQVDRLAILGTSFFIWKKQSSIWFAGAEYKKLFSLYILLLIIPTICFGKPMAGKHWNLWSVHSAHSNRGFVKNVEHRPFNVIPSVYTTIQHSNSYVVFHLHGYKERGFTLANIVLQWFHHLACLCHHGTAEIKGIQWPTLHSTSGSTNPFCFTTLLSKFSGACRFISLCMSIHIEVSTKHDHRSFSSEPECCGEGGFEFSTPPFEKDGASAPGTNIWRPVQRQTLRGTWKDSR